MTSRQELADGGPHGSPEARRHGGPKKVVLQSGRAPRKRLPEARPVADKTPRWRAERRRIFPKGRCAIELPDAPSRRAIPSYLRGTEMEYGVPGAAKNTGGGALATSCSPDERSEIRDSHVQASPRISLRSSGLQTCNTLRSSPRTRGSRLCRAERKNWISACAGMSGARGRRAMHTNASRCQLGGRRRAIA
jgi:hypothetical protein